MSRETTTLSNEKRAVTASGIGGDENHDLLAPLALATKCVCRRGEIIPASVTAGEAYALLEQGILLLDLVANGRSFAVDFISPGQTVLPALWLGQDHVDSVSFTAIESCLLLIWPRASIEAELGWRQWYEIQRDLIDRATSGAGRRFVSRLTRSVLERYCDMQEEFPEIWQRLPQHLIASYLGVTPQYLCQLKRQATEREKPSRSETS